MEKITAQKQALRMLEKANLLLHPYATDRTHLTMAIAELQSDVDYAARLEAEQKRMPRSRAAMKGFTL